MWTNGLNSGWCTLFSSFSVSLCFSGWRQWVRVKSQCWVTQWRKSTQQRSPLWTSVWMTRPWTWAWSVTAHRLTTTLWCATPPHPCNLPAAPMATLTASRPLLCSPLFWLLSLGLNVWEKKKTTFPQSVSEKMLWSDTQIFSTVTSQASAVRQKGNLQTVDLCLSDAGWGG